MNCNVLQNPKPFSKMVLHLIFPLWDLALPNFFFNRECTCIIFCFNLHFPVTNEIEYLVFVYFSYIHISGDLHAQIFCSLCWDKDIYFLNTEFWTYILWSGFQPFSELAIFRYFFKYLSGILNFLQLYFEEWRMLEILNKFKWPLLF